MLGGGVVADAGPHAETLHLGDRVDLRLRVYRIPVLGEQMPAVRCAADCLVVRHASGARFDRRGPELIPVGLRSEADAAPYTRIAGVVEAELVVVEVLRVRPEAATVAGGPGERVTGFRRQLTVGALKALLPAPPHLEEAQRLVCLRAQVAVHGNREATGVELALDRRDRGIGRGLGCLGRGLRGTGKKEVTWAYVLSGLVSLALLVYLLIALIFAEDL